MPNRYVREGINSSRAVASLDAATEVFYRRMINVVDDFGRFEVDTMLIRSHAFPVHQNISESDISGWLARCEKAGLIVLYEVAGRHYLVLTKTERPRAQNSRFPDPPPDVVARFGLFTSASANMCSHVKTFAPNTTPNTTPNAGARAGETPTPLTADRAGETRAPLMGDRAGETPTPLTADRAGGMHAPLTGASAGGTRAPLALVPTESEAVEMTATAGIPPDFARLVYQDWSSRGGRDGAGNVVPWLPYVTKRWAREQVEWRAGTHRGKKSAGKSKIERPAGVPSQAEVMAYAKEKWGDCQSWQNWGLSFYMHWADPKRQWRRNGNSNGALIDWKIELTAQVAKWRLCCDK